MRQTYYNENKVFISQNVIIDRSTKERKLLKICQNDSTYAKPYRCTHIKTIVSYNL
jgi:hypothetical protein